MDDAEAEQSFIRGAITKVLPDLSDTSLQLLEEELQTLGVETGEDLKFIKESDLLSVRPIQARRLLSAWKQSSTYALSKFVKTFFTYSIQYVNCIIFSQHQVMKSANRLLPPRLHSPPPPGIPFLHLALHPPRHAHLPRPAVRFRFQIGLTPSKFHGASFQKRSFSLWRGGKD